EHGFTLIEILIALVITAMTLVAVNQMVSGIVRAQKTAEIRATAASLADSAMEYALLSNEAGEINLQETIQKARQTGWTIVFTRSPAPLSGFETAGSFETVSVRVSGNTLEPPFEITRLHRITDYSDGEE
ncbi:MAG: type II secretion system protein, partial [bacterium]